MKNLTQSEWVVDGLPWTTGLLSLIYFPRRTSTSLHLLFCSPNLSLLPKASESIPSYLLWYLKYSRGKKEKKRLSRTFTDLPWSRLLNCSGGSLGVPIGTDILAPSNHPECLLLSRLKFCLKMSQGWQPRLSGFREWLWSGLVRIQRRQRLDCPFISPSKGQQQAGLTYWNSFSPSTLFSQTDPYHSEKASLQRRPGEERRCGHGGT